MTYSFFVKGYGFGGEFDTMEEALELASNYFPGLEMREVGIGLSVSLWRNNINVGVVGPIQATS